MATAMKQEPSNLIYQTADSRSRYGSILPFQQPSSNKLNLILSEPNMDKEQPFNTKSMIA
jgi:hypothetical protein